MKDKHSLFPDKHDTKEIIGYARLGVFVTNGNGDIINANDALLQIADLSLDMLKKMQLMDVIQLQSRKADILTLLDVEAEGKWIGASIKIGKHSGKPCFIIPMRSLSSIGVHVFLLTFATEDEEELLCSLAHTQLLGNNQQGYVIMNWQGKIVDINEYAATCYGFSREELLHSYKKNKLHGFTKDYFLGMRTIETGIPFRNYVVSWKVNDKNRSFVIDTMILRNEKKEKVGVCVLIRDITTVRSVELQVQHNERLAMVAQIAAGAAHEIKNPITSVRGFLQFLKISLKKNEMERELQYAEVMLTEIDRVSELLDELLLLSSPTDLQIEKAKPQDLFDNLAEIIKEETKFAAVNVKYQIDDTPYIKIDKELIQQVLLNIIRNAIDAMPDGGELFIGADCVLSEQVVRIQIKDTGHGIPAYMIDKIFDPFFTTKATGTGLGLAVCQRIINDHGGNMRVISKGYGTIFVINLPMTTEEDHD